MTPLAPLYSRRARTRSVIAAVVGTAALLVGAVALAWQPMTAPSKALAERIKRDVAHCKSTENLETCDDAVRWDPNDPALLVAFGDALMRDRHAAEALRQYQRAASLAPRLPGVNAKISAAETRLSRRGQARPAQARPSAPAPASAALKPAAARNSSPQGQTPGSPYTNDAVESHTH